MTRDQAVKARQAEGVQVKGLQYTLQHKCAVYSEENWWHHKPVIPELPGSEQANATSRALPYFKIDAPELVEQYVKAFEKLWAHRNNVGKIALVST